MLYKNISRSSFTLLILIISTTVFAQNSVGIGTENPNENAVLHLVSPNNDQGLLVPQLTTLERTSPAFLARLGTNENGLLVFDSDDNQFYYWQDTQWQPISTNVNLVAGAGIDIAGNIISNLGDADADAQNEIQDLQDVLGQGNDAGGTVISNLGDPSLAQDAATKAYVDGVIVADSDGDPTNEIQDLSIASNTLSISGSAATVDLTAYLDNSDSQDALNVPVVPAGNLASTDVQAALEELQGDIDGDTDSDPNNEIQDASGVAVTPVGNLVSVDVQAALEELQVDLDTDTDADPLNEIQNISITGNAIGIDGGGLGFNLSPLVPGSGEVLKWNGTQWEAATDATAAGSTLPLLGNAQIVTNNGANTAVSVSGDINMDNTGNMTVQPDAITTSEIQDLTVTDIDIDPGANIGVGKLNSSVMVETENVSLLNNDAGYLTNLATLSTDDLSEGISNLYYTDARVDTRLAFNSVTILSDVSNAGSGQIITAGERSGISTNSADIATLQATGLGFSQTPNQIYAGPPSGLAADPTFRTLVQADIPGLDASYIITGTLPAARGGTNSSSIGSAGAVSYSNGTAYQFSGAGTAGQILSSNGAGAPTWIDDDFGWGLNGNGGVNAVTDFVGSINAADVLFKSNNIERLRITSGGDVGIGGPGSAVTGNKLRVVQTLAASGDAIESVLNTTSPAGSSAALRTVVTNSGAGTSFGAYSAITNVIGSSGGGTGYFTILNGDGDGARSGVNVNVSGGGTGSKYGYLTNVSASAGANGYGLYVQDVAGSTNNYGVFIESLSNEPSFFPAIFMDGNVGIGTVLPATTLDVTGTIQTDGFQLTSATSPGYVLTSDASGTGTWSAIPSQFGINNNIPKGNGTILTTSSIYDDGLGNVGFGIASPTAGLHSTSNNGALLGGNFGFGNIPTVTAGTRMMWYPSKAAFRAGRIITDASDVSIGAYSTVLGYDGIASGQGSAVIGYGGTAAGFAAMAIGTANDVPSLQSVGVGAQNLVAADNSYAIGYINNINIGATESMVLGHLSEANGQNSYAFGRNINSNGVGSFIIGKGINSGNEITNTIDNSLMVGFDSTVPTFFVGPSFGVGTTGNVGIGNSTPASKLDVSGTITSTGFTMTTAPTLGYVLTTDGTGSGSWQAVPGPSGPAGGDLTGTYPNPTITTDAVGSSEIANNTIVNADINGAAAISGTKINPDFGSQNVITTGDVQVDATSEFKYSSPKSHIYAITPAEFVILKNFVTQDFEMLYSITGIEARVGSGGPEVAANYGAPIHLPDEAVITSIEVWGRNSSTTIPTNIYFVEKSFSTAQTPIFVTTIPINTGAFVTSYTNNALNIPINNNTDNYLLRVEASTDGGSITGVKIIYEVLRAD